MLSRLFGLLLVLVLGGCAFLDSAAGVGNSTDTAAATAPPTSQSALLARVNGASLTRADLERRQALVQTLVWLSGGDSRIELSESTHIDRWVESELLYQAATRAGIVAQQVDAEKEIRRLLETRFFTEVDLDRQLGVGGLTRAELVAYQQRALTVQKFTEQSIWQGASEVEKQSRLATWLVRERAGASIERPSAQTPKPIVGTYAGSVAPGFSLPDLGGETRALSKARGKVLLVNFWATWCGPCRREMPAIQAVYDANRNNGFDVWAVNVGEEAAEVRRYVTALNLAFSILLDTDSKVSKAYRVYALPTTYFIGRDGDIRQVAIGEMNETSLDDTVRRILR